jgi:ribonuclease E
VLAELKRDRARSRVLRMSRFGLMQITRQRVRQGTKLALYSACPTCAGAGLVRSPQSMVPHVMRQIRLALSKKEADTIQVSVHPAVAELLTNAKRSDIARIEHETRRTVRVLAHPDSTPGQCEVVCYLKDGSRLAK